MAATAAVTHVEDPDFMTELKRTLSEMKTTYEELLEAKMKGLPLGDLTEKCAKLETAMAEKIDKKAFDNEVRAMKERGSRPPVQLGASGEEIFSMGQQVVEHELFKGLKTTTRPKMQVTLKGRLVPTRERRAAPFISEAGAGWVFFPKRVGVFTEPIPPLIVRDLFDVIPLTEGNGIEYVKEHWTYNADYQVLEGDKKAQSDVVYTDATVNVRTIAHFIKISRQMLADVPYLTATINTRMIYGIAKKEDYELLWGNNTAGHLWGLMPQATLYAAPPQLDPINSIEQIYTAMVQMMATGYSPSAIVLNPVDFAAMSLYKNAMGMYVLGGPPVVEATPRLWGVPVALTMSMTAGQFLVGSFPGNAALFDRETPTVDIAFENEDDFVRNLVTIRAEERIALAVYVPQAFIKGGLMAPVPPAELLSRSGEVGKGGKH